jgi:hypothetical protein
MIGKNGYTRSDYLKAEWAAKVYREMVFCPSGCDFSYGYSLNRPGSFELSRLKEYLQSDTFTLEYTLFSLDQPYHIELWVEKATMNSILQPLCARYNAVLVTFQGHCSWGGAWKLCKRVNNDNRLALIFYPADELWLLDTKNEIYPSREDIDFCERGVAY